MRPSDLKPTKEAPRLRGPAAILFESRDACSDSIAKLLVLVFFILWSIAHLLRDMGIAPFWGGGDFPENVFPRFLRFHKVRIVQVFPRILEKTKEKDKVIANTDL